MPTENEIVSLLTKLFQERPCEKDITFSEAVKVLVGRPISDIPFLVQEAARIAAKSQKSKIDSTSFDAALRLLQARKQESGEKRIGF